MMTKFVRVALTAGMLAVSVSVCSAVKVVESKSVEQQARDLQQEQQNSVLMQLYNQLQMMQDELMQLRGMAEAHEYQIQEIKQQQRDDYLQLDSRIGELTVISASGANEADDETAYKQAYQLIQERKFKESIAAFETFLKEHGSSAWRPNVYYWLGELYIVEDNATKAIENFTIVAQQFENDRKYPDALYKLASLDIQQGKKQEAAKKLDVLLEYIENNPSYASLKDKALALKKQHSP